MFSQRILRVFLKSNLCPNRITLSKYSNGFFTRNIHISENVLPSENDTGSGERINHFKNYILKNNNFKNPVLEISNLNFPIDSKHESLKLLFQFKENPDEIGLLQDMVDCLTKEVKTFELEDFLKTLAIAGSFKFKSDVYETFKTCLCTEIISRKFTLDELLEIMFVLKHSLYMKKTHLTYKFHYKLNKKLLVLDKLQTYQVVHLFYYFEKFNSESRKYYGFYIFKYAKENLPVFNVDEMGIIFQGLNRAGLFKMDKCFIEGITKKILNEIDSILPQHFYQICRFLELSSFEFHSVAVSNFQEQLIEHLSKFNSGVLIAALFANHPHSLNLNLWNKLKERFLSELETLSIFEYKRITELMASFNIKAEEFLKLAIQELEGRPNFSLGNPHVVTFCKNVILHGIYPKKLLESILSKDYVEGMMQRSFYMEIYDWAFINYSLQLDKPQLSVTLDPIAKKKIMTKPLYVITNKKKPLSNYNVRKKLYKLLKNIYGEDKVLDGYCLPHFKQGIIMRFDRNLNALPIPEEFINMSRGNVKKPVDDQIWLCMNLCVSPPDDLCPFLKTYVRHLTAVGFKPFLWLTKVKKCVGISNSKDLLSSGAFLQVHQTEFLKKYVLRNEETTAYVQNVVQAALEKALQEEQKA